MPAQGHHRPGGVTNRFPFQQQLDVAAGGRDGPIERRGASTTAATTVDLNRCDDIGETDTFGQLTGARAPREIQLSFKLY